MFRKALIATAVVASTLSAAPAFAMTVGFVDTAKVLMTYSGARNAQSRMQQELIAYQKAFGERQKKIAEAQKAGKSAAEIQKMTEDYEKELAPLKAKAQSLEANLSADVKVKVEARIKAIAKAKKLDLVLDKAAVLFGGVDITNDVIQALR